VFCTVSHIINIADCGRQVIFCDMVQKESLPKARGRPRSYDPDLALQRATEAFWKAGYAGTSLDDLAAAMAMNRPSLYAAFGDKQALYLRALNRYWERGLKAMDEALRPEMPLAETLYRLYELALGLYFPSKGRSRGCFGIGTALTEAVEDPLIRAAFAHGLRRIHAGFQSCISRAKSRGELAESADVETLAGLASAVLTSLAVRSRAGMPREGLEKFAQSSARAIATLGSGGASAG
jgi:TetR/AcrR family transcriptional regulator, copper-responsive repressor